MILHLIPPIILTKYIILTHYIESESYSISLSSTFLVLLYFTISNPYNLYLDIYLFAHRTYPLYILYSFSIRTITIVHWYRLKIFYIYVYLHIHTYIYILFIDILYHESISLSLQVWTMFTTCSLLVHYLNSELVLELHIIENEQWYESIYDILFDILIYIYIYIFHR